jgi:hypothetical protein
MNNIEKFHSLVKDQFSYGGKKYASDQNDNQKEATDYLVEDFTYLWLLGTFAKYAKRFKNLARERDLLKIACYMYICWLKRGFHLNKNGLPKIINTNVQNKTDNFDSFISEVKYQSELMTVGDNIDSVYRKIKDMTDTYLDLPSAHMLNIDHLHEKDMRDIIQEGFLRIKEKYLIYIYLTCYNIWNKMFSENPGQDTDTERNKS